MAGMQINAVKVEEDSVHAKEQVDVNGGDAGDNQKGGRTEELIDPFIGDDRKWGWIVKDVMVFVLLPKGKVDVSKSMI